MRCSFTLCAFSNLGTAVPLFFLGRKIRSSRICSPPPRPHCFLILPPPPAAMAPKNSKGKGAAKDAGEKEALESKLAVRRTQLTYFPSTVDAVHLRNYF